MKWMKVLALFSMFALTACNFSSNENKLEHDKVYEVKVLYNSNQAFMELYGEEFMANFPNILIDVISLPRTVQTEEEFRKTYSNILKLEKPDLIFVPDLIQFSSLINDNVLLNLDGYVNQGSAFKNYHQGVLSAIKEFGGGNIYGLSPTYNRNALFFNKELFEKFHIPFPYDKMTWNDLFDLTSEFHNGASSEGNAMAGLAFYGYSNAYQIIGEIASTQNLDLIDKQGQLRFDQKEWREIVTSVISGIREGSVYIVTSSFHDSPEETDAKNVFVNGNAAMAISSSGMVNMLKYDFPWGVVTEPVNETNSDLSYSLYFPNLFAINKETKVVPAVWELLKYMNLNFEMNHASKYTNFQLTSSANQEEWKGTNVRSLSRFSGKLWPVVNEAPEGFYGKFSLIANQYFEQCINGSISIEEAIGRIQTSGEQLLNG